MRNFGNLFRRGCKNYIKRYENQIEFDASAQGTGGLKIDLSLVNRPYELVRATDLAVNLDNTQFLLCQEIAQLKDDSELEYVLKRRKIQIILAIGQLQNICASLVGGRKSDIKLRKELLKWIKFMNILYKDSILSLDPRQRKAIGKGDSTKRLHEILKYQGMNEDQLQKALRNTQPDFRKLLLDGRITRFNELREEDRYAVINLKQIDLQGMNLEGIDFRSSDLSHANLKETYLKEADLSNAILRGADLSNANLSNAIMWHTDLSNSKLDNIDLTDATIIDTSFTGVTGKNLGQNLARALLTQLHLINVELADLTFPTFYINPGRHSMMYVFFRYKELTKLLYERLHRKEREEAIRYIGICDTNSREFVYSCHNKNTEPILTHKEKTILLLMSCRSWEFRKELEPNVGSCIYATEKFERIRRLSIPLDKDYLLLLTTDSVCDLNPLISGIFNVPPKNNQNKRYLQNRDHISRFADLPQETNCCKPIVDLDPLIRASFQCKKSGEIIDHYVRPSVTPLLSSDQLQKSFRLTAKKWQLRMRFKDRIGLGIYSMAKFEKVTRLSMPMHENNLLFVAVEPEAEPEHIAKLVINSQPYKKRK